MLTRLWHSCFPEFSSQQVWRHNFYLCQVSELERVRRSMEANVIGLISVWCVCACVQWQTDQDVGIFYLIYRWLSAILFLAVLSCSLLDIGRSDEPRYEHHYAKWWIYLTHWGLMACAVQAWLGAWIVTAGLMVDRDDYGEQTHTHDSRDIVRRSRVLVSEEARTNAGHQISLQKHIWIWKSGPTTKVPPSFKNNFY